MQSAEEALVIENVPPDGPAATSERAPAEPKPLVRLGCGAAGLIAAAGVAATIGLHLDALAGVAFVLVLAVICVFDLEQMRVPNQIVVPAIAVALIWQIAFHRSDLPWVLGAAVGGGLFFGIAAVLTRGSIGMGDAKLAVLIGLVLGEDIVAALFFATLAGAAAAGVVLWRHGRAAGKTPMPYAPFLAAGAVIALLVGTSSPILH
jgi:leader peptidase (prepilin peptidase)/N-methyltransferase